MYARRRTEAWWFHAERRQQGRQGFRPKIIMDMGFCDPSSESVVSMGSCPAQPIFSLNRVHKHKTTAQKLHPLPIIFPATCQTQKEAILPLRRQYSLIVISTSHINIFVQQDAASLIFQQILDNLAGCNQPCHGRHTGHPARPRMP